MTPLQWDIRNVLKANGDGARTTQYQRQAMLFRFAADLQRLGTAACGCPGSETGMSIGSWRSGKTKD